MPRKKKTVEAPAKVDHSPFNRSAFIREHSDKSPKEIVELAASQGHEVKIGLVYAVRTDAKKGARKAPGKRGPKPGAKSATKSGAFSSNVHASHKSTLRHMCFLVGAENVRTLLNEIETEIKNF